MVQAPSLGGGRLGPRARLGLFHSRPGSIQPIFPSGRRYTTLVRPSEARRKTTTWALVESSSIAAPETVISLNRDDGSAMTAGWRSSVSPCARPGLVALRAGSLFA